MENINNTEQYDKFYNFFWKSFSHLTDLKKSEFINFWFEKFISLIRARLWEDFKEKYTINEIHNYLTMSEDEFIFNLNKEKFENFYWSKFKRSNEELKNELSSFWFDEFIKRCEDRKLDKTMNLNYLYYYINLNEEEFRYQIEYEKFKEHFWQSFFRRDKELIDSMINYWYDNFIEKCKNNNIDLTKTKFFTAFELITSWTDVQGNIRKKEEYRKFLDRFDTRFFSLKEEVKDDLVEIWFDNFIDSCKKKKINADEHSLSYVLYVLSRNEEQERYDTEYELFKNRFWRRFIDNKEETINKLVEIWFDNFMRISKENEFDIDNKKLVFFLEFIESWKDYSWQIEYDKFYERFWSSFSLTNKEDIWDAIKFWFDNFMKVYEERNIEDYWYVFSYNFYLIKLNEKEFKEEINYNKYKETFWKRLDMLLEEKRKEVLDVWYELFMKRINERLWWYDKNEKFELYYKFWIMSDTEYKEFMNKRKFLDKYWFSFSQINKDSLNELLEYWFDEFEKDVKDKWIDEELSLRQKLELLKKDKKEFKREIELKKFRNEFSNRKMSWVKDDVIEELLRIWFENFMKVLDERNLDYENANINYLINEILKDEEEFNKSREEEKFIEFFWKTFSSLLSEKKEKMINIWFNEILSRMKERNIDWTFSMNEIYEKCSCSKEEFHKIVEYEKFFNTFWKKFSSLDEDKKEELIKIWFDNLLNKLKEKWISIDWVTF